MKMMRWASIILIVLVVYTIPLNGIDAFTTDTIPALVSEVNSDYLLDTLIYLTAFPNRSSYEIQEEVFAFIGAELGNAGAIIQLHEYEYDGQTWHNLVATVPTNASLVPTEPHLVVGAHIDSVPISPGADDNASGVAAIMEAARVLASTELTTRIDFVFFSLEELGTIGSSHYAADAKVNGEDIIAMIAVDMIGYEFSNEDLQLVTKPSMNWIAEDYKQASDTYTNLDTTLILDWSCG